MRNIITKLKKKRHYKNLKKYKETHEYSTLMVDHSRGHDRCSLFLVSADTDQLKELQSILAQRNIGSDLLEHFHGGRGIFNIDLTCEKHMENFKQEVEDRLETMERFFVYGKPIPNLDYFTKEEQELMLKWKFKSEI